MERRLSIIRHSHALSCVLIAGMLVACTASALAAAALPAASDLTARMIQRAQAVAQAEHSPHYTYQKRSVLVRLDADGQVTKSVDKLYEVRWINGLPFNRLVKIQGRDLTPEELKAEEAREERFHQKFVTADRKKLVARREALMKPEMLNRYDFQVLQRIVLSNRPTLVVKFKPKAGDLPAESIQDRLLNRMAGTIWVDEAESDIVRLMVSLVEPFSLGWLGWIGSLNQCELNLERERMPDGVWINNKLTLSIQCRKLASSIRFRTTEESSGFQRVVARN